MAIVSVASVVDYVSSFESRAAAAGLAAGDARWLSPWRVRIPHRLLVELWDNDDPDLVELARELADYVVRHEIHWLDDAVAYFREAPSVGRADYLFNEIVLW